MSLRLKRDVVVSGREGAWYLTDLATGTTYEINATGRRVVDAIRAGADEPACVRALVEAFPDVPEDEIARDVRALVADLVEAGVVEARP